MTTNEDKNTQRGVVVTPSQDSGLRPLDSGCEQRRQGWVRGLEPPTFRSTVSRQEAATADTAKGSRTALPVLAQALESAAAQGGEPLTHTCLLTQTTASWVTSQAERTAGLSQRRSNLCSRVLHRRGWGPSSSLPGNHHASLSERRAPTNG